MTSFFGWTPPPVVYVIFYGTIFASAACFLIVVSRKHAPTARREAFRKPSLIWAAGVLLLSAAAIVLMATVDAHGNVKSAIAAWVGWLEVGLVVVGIALVVIAGRANRRAEALYPGKHADPASPPRVRRRLFF